MVVEMPGHCPHRPGGEQQVAFLLGAICEAEQAHPPAFQPMSERLGFLDGDGVNVVGSHDEGSLFVVVRPAVVPVHRGGPIILLGRERRFPVGDGLRLGIAGRCEFGGAHFEAIEISRNAGRELLRRGLGPRRDGRCSAIKECRHAVPFGKVDALDLLRRREVAGQFVIDRFGKLFLVIARVRLLQGKVQRVVALAQALQRHHSFDFRP